jgi:KUP system potassium uptake protein
MLIVSFKYVWVVLHFDNEGEGGVLALTAFAHRLTRGMPRAAAAVVIGAGVFGAALFYGDAVITPAISVLSAIEGLGVAAPSLAHGVEPITVGILIGLFVIQRHGTGRVGRWFGPITLLWFTSLGALGIVSIAATPKVLAAVNPVLAVRFLLAHPGPAFILLAAVFLALTGGEALYADMGHFGARAVRVAWYGLVCPALLLNYFGQGARVLRNPAAVRNPFYLLAPDWFLWPLLGLATAATVIASQATITGAFSTTLQASRLGYLPRVRILHTSDRERGQIYVPSVNWLMLIAVILLVLEFGSSGALAAAYGIAVSGTMLVTTLLVSAVVLSLPNRRRRSALLTALVLFAALELGFLGANLTKLAAGGWFPLVLGIGLLVVLTTWKRGSELIALQRRKFEVPIAALADRLPLDVPRVPGSAVYVTSDPELVPSALFHNVKHYKVIHEQNLFLHVQIAEVPYIAPDNRTTVQSLGNGMRYVQAQFGFREEPDVPAALALVRIDNQPLEPSQTSYFVARSVIVDGPGALPRWRCALFSWMTRQAESAAIWFNLPTNRVVELGTQVLL